jgi:hypothetical protein
MKKIIIALFLSLAVFLNLSNIAFAISNRHILKNILSQKAIGYKELAVINYLVNNNVRFTVKDLRRLLRNYGGKTMATLKAANKAASSLTALMATGKKINYNVSNNAQYCSDYQYFLDNGKILKKKLSYPICDNTYKTSAIYGVRIKTYLYVGKVYHEKALAKLVYKILKKYKNVYKDINKQGRHYQTALYIAASEDMPHTVYILLTDKDIKPTVTSIPKEFTNQEKWYYIVKSLRSNGEIEEETSSNTQGYQTYVYPIENFGRAFTIKQWNTFDLAVEKKLLGITENMTWCSGKGFSILYGEVCGYHMSFNSDSNVIPFKYRLQSIDSTTFFLGTHPAQAEKMNPYKKYKP